LLLSLSLLIWLLLLLLLLLLGHTTGSANDEFW
jgi:hypothetical protein